MQKDDFTLISFCGSRLFGLEEDASDYDYMALAVNAEQELISDQFKQIQLEDGDYFCMNLRDMLTIENCASALVAPDYDSVLGGSSQTLKDFWAGHAAALADICPLATYNSALAQTEIYLERFQQPRALKVAVRLLGLLWCRYYTGDLLPARQLTPVWRERYFAAKRGEIGAAEIKTWYDQLCAPSIRRYFEAQPTNLALHEQYKAIINTVLEG